jgi:hypothetical protein
MHLRDDEAQDPYQMRVVIYYTAPETERMDVDEQIVAFTTAEPGEKLFKF